MSTTRYRDVVLADSPLGFWRLNEADVNSPVVDYSGNSRHGAFAGSGGTFRAAGPCADLPFALDCAGTRRAQIDYLAALAPTAAITVECWAYQSNWATYAASAVENALVSKTEGGGYLIVLNHTSAAGRLACLVRRNGAYATLNWDNTATLAAGWHQFVCTFDGQFTKLYVDGALVVTNDAGATYAIQYANSNHLQLGAEAGALDVAVTPNYMQGRLGNVSIYGTALSAARVLAHYNARTVTDEPSTAGYNAKFKVGTFIKKVGTGAQTITDLPFRPKGVIFWLSHQPTDNGSGEGPRMIVGFDDGTHRRGVQSFADKNVNPSNATRAIDGSASIIMWNSNLTVDSSGYISSFTDDGFVVTWPTAAGSTWIHINFLAFGGDDVECFSGVFTSSGSTGAQAITGVGFEPSAVFFLPIGWTGSLTGQATTPYGLSLGFSAGPGQDALVMGFSRHNVSPSQTKSYQRTDRCISDHTTGVAAVERQASMTSFDADGFTLNWDVALADYCLFFAIKGIAATVTAITQPAASSTVRVSSLFPIGAVFTASVGRAASSTVDAENRLTFGAADAWGDNRASMGVDLNGSVISYGGRYQSKTSAIWLAHSAGAVAVPVTKASAVIDCDSDDGVDFIWTVVDGSVARQVVVLLMGPLVFPEVEPNPQVDISGETVPLVWVEHSRDDDTTHSIAKVRLPDPAIYFGGHKLPLVLSFGEIKRGLSNLKGGYQGASWSWKASDIDGAQRARLAGVTTRYEFVNRNVIGRMIGDIDRRLGNTPRVIFRGLLRQYNPIEDRTFEYTAEDFLAAKVSISNLDRAIPRRLLTRTIFPNLSSDQLNKPIPIIYGRYSDAGSEEAPPTLNGTAARGGYVDEGSQIFGTGDLASSAAIPTGVIVAAAPGGTLPIDPNSDYGVIVTAVDASGNETNSAPFYFNQAGGGTRGSWPGVVPTVAVSGTDKITVSWSAAAGAALYRVYLGTYYYGGRFQQYIETASLSCEFTAGPAFGETATVDNITPGANLIEFGQFWYYRVTAIAADGLETGVSAIGFGSSSPYRRPIRIEWLAVSGALGYRVYRKGPTGDLDRMAEVSAAVLYFDDDLLDTGWTFIDHLSAATGLVPLKSVGEETIDGFSWDRYLVQLGCSKEVEGLFLNGTAVDAGSYGVTWLVPGKTGWPFPENYRDVNGVRLTLVYGRGPESYSVRHESVVLTANVSGLETIGDGTGELIESGPQIYKHFVTNFGFQDSDGGIGGWLTIPEWEDPYLLSGPVPQIDEDSFDTAEAVADRRVSGGYPGAGIIGGNDEQITLREVLKRLNNSFDVRCGFNRNSQFFITMFDESLSVLAAARKITQARNIIAKSFKLTEKVDELANVQPYSYARNFKTGEWGFEDVEVSDASSQTSYRETKRGDTIELWFVRSAVVAADIASRSLVFTKHVRRVADFQEPLSGLITELGDIVKIDHLDGVGSNGYVDAPIWIEQHDFDPDRLKVRMTGYDVERLFAGAFILGSDAWGVNWLTASAEQKLYGFLCDDTTGQFSDGTEGKRVR